MSTMRGLRDGQVNNYEYVVASQNLLVNPGFEVWQRGVGPFSTHLGYTADEWELFFSSGTWSVVPSASPYSGVNCASVTASGTVVGYLIQGVELWQTLQAQTITFSCWVKCSVASAARLFIADYTAAGSQTTASAFHTGSGNWERLTVVRTIRSALTPNVATWPHGFPIIMMVAFGQPVTGALVDGATCVIGNYPEGVSYVPQMPAEELRRCQRFFEVHGGKVGGHPAFMNYGYAGLSFVLTQQFKEQKFATPTCTVSGNWTLTNLPSPLVTTYASKHGYCLYQQSTASTLSQFYPADATGIVSIAVP
jgi:hypothetical protein